MKKLALITMASAAAAFGVYGQGSLSGIQTTFVNEGITIGNGAHNSSYFTGNVDIELLYSSTATAGTVTALDALDGTESGSAELTTAQSDGFSVVSLTSVNGQTTGIANNQTYAVVNGAFAANNGTDPNEIGLFTPVPTSGTGIMAMYVTIVGGADNGDSGLFAWSGQAFGGSSQPPTPGIPSAINKDPGPGGDNLDIVTAPVPEPATLAFAGLGGLSVLLFRRRK